MDKREAAQEIEEISVASESIFFDIPSPQAEETTLSWRNDNNFSDWKLQIKIRNDSANNSNAAGDVQNSSTFLHRTYCVHRNILAIGQRRSGYFANLFHYGIDDGDRCSRIELSSRAVDCFPDLLDFMYSSKAFAITTTNSIALLFLSQAFQVVDLEARVKLFIDKDIKLYNFGYYMSGALYFSDETIALKVINTCEQEAILLMNDATPSADRGLETLLKVPLLLSAMKAEKFCHSVWSLLTHEQQPLQTKKKLFQIFFRRKAPH